MSVDDGVVGAGGVGEVVTLTENADAAAGTWYGWTERIAAVTSYCMWRKGETWSPSEVGSAWWCYVAAKSSCSSWQASTVVVDACPGFAAVAAAVESLSIETLNIADRAFHRVIAVAAFVAAAVAECAYSWPFRSLEAACCYCCCWHCC